jgi:hypothetical protein
MASRFAALLLPQQVPPVRLRFAYGSLVKAARVDFAVHRKRQLVGECVALLEPTREFGLLAAAMLLSPAQPLQHLSTAGVDRAHAQRKPGDRAAAAAEAFLCHGRSA